MSPDVERDCHERHPVLKALGVRGVFLFLNFLLIITALYHLKPASRSLFIEFLGADSLPYVWIGTAVVMGTTIGIYHRLVERVRRIRLVLSSCLLFALAFIGFRLWLMSPGPGTAFCLYILVDIFGVVLVEQFWSLTNSIYSTHEGKGWYGFIGTGGLVGGILGGELSRFLLKGVGWTTSDLLWVAAGIILLIGILTGIMGRLGLYCGVEGQGEPTRHEGGWEALRGNRYLVSIAGILLLAQLVSPLIDFQFSKTLEAALPVLDERTAYIGRLYSVLGLIAIGVNLVLTPAIHKTLGVMAGLLVQPLAIMVCSVLFMVQPLLLVGAAAKISDRGLSYSINRASKELLYVPIDTVLIYRAKAWIDMFGYRLFKILGSGLILLFTPWVSLGQLSWLNLVIVLVWLGVVVRLGVQYRTLASSERSGDDQPSV